MNTAIRLDSLTKTFRVAVRRPGLRGALHGLFRPQSTTATAVDRLSLRVATGQRVAVIGPNGAGKSTAIKMLCGILHPTSGHAEVDGLVPWEKRRALAYRIGTVFGQRSQLWYHLPAADTFELLAHVYDVEPAEHRRRQAELVERFDIGECIDRPVRQLSLGQRMRCEVVASLLHDPSLLFLDEPTIGLDVTAKATIREEIRRECEQRGRTVLLTSHDTADIERVCDRVVILHRGRLLLDEPIDRLRNRVGGRKRVTLETAERELSLDLPGVQRLEHRPHHLVVEVDVQRCTVQSVVAAALHGGTLRDLSIEDPPLDDVIATIYSQAFESPP